MFGQGFVTLEYLTERMPAYAFDAWAAFYEQWHSDKKLRDDTEDHEDVMKKASRALAARTGI